MPVVLATPRTTAVKLLAGSMAKMANSCGSAGARPGRDDLRFLSSLLIVVWGNDLTAGAMQFEDRVRKRIGN